MMLKYYCLISLALTIGAIYSSYQEQQQFYPTLMYLTTNKINRTILINFAIMIISASVLLIIKLIFGELKEIEIISVIDKTKRKILDIAYLLFFFYTSLDWQFLILIIWLISLSIIHWITIKRAGFLIAESCFKFFDHFRLIFLFLILFYIDIKISFYFFSLDEDTFQNILFGFEFVLLPIRLMMPFLKYLINLFETLTYSQFELKPIILSALDVFLMIFKLIIQLLLFRYIIQTQGFMLLLFVDTFENVVALFKKIKAFYNQVKLILMIEKIQDVQQDQQHDNICLICLDELVDGKMLQCGHVFHKTCLKTWITGNSNLFCPKCKNSIKLEENIKLSQIGQNQRKKVLLLELREIKSNIQLLQTLSKFRQIQNQVQNSQGIGSVQFGLPCQAVYQTTPLTEIKRLQINKMNKIIKGIEDGYIEDYLIPKFD